MRLRVELLWWEGCPSTEATRAMLEDALAEAGAGPSAVELREIVSEEQAEAERFIGSPTIRIDGRDVLPTPDEPFGLNCRVYRLRDGRHSPTPDPADIRDAIREAMR